MSKEGVCEDGYNKDQHYRKKLRDYPGLAGLCREKKVAKIEKYLQDNQTSTAEVVLRTERGCAYC